MNLVEAVIATFLIPIYIAVWLEFYYFIKGIVKIKNPFKKDEN